MGGFDVGLSDNVCVPPEADDAAAVDSEFITAELEAFACALGADGVIGVGDCDIDVSTDDWTDAEDATCPFSSAIATGLGLAGAAFG